jgi:hypothetical protein
MIRFSDMLLVILGLAILAVPVFGQSWLPGVCFRDSKGDIVCLPQKPNQIVSGNGLTGNPLSVAVNSPKCPEGYSAVFRSSGQPACAKEIIEPQ